MVVHGQRREVKTVIFLDGKVNERERDLQISHMEMSSRIMYSFHLALQIWLRLTTFTLPFITRK